MGGMTMVHRFVSSIAAMSVAAAAFANPTLARAEDTLKLAVSQKGQWDTAMPEFGVRKGFFKEQGLNLEILYTNGTTETQQAVLSGSVDVGIAVGFLGLLAAYTKGAPLRVISAEFTGASDFYWYVRGDSPIKQLSDAKDATFGFSTVGSSSNLVLIELLKQANLEAKPTPTGGTAATMTQVMSKQIDVGWTQVPLGLADVDAGKIRILAKGSDVKAVVDQTTRVSITSAQVLEQKGDQLKRFMTAYQKTLDWAYSGPEAMQFLASDTNQPIAIIQKARDENYPKSALALDKISGFAQSEKQAIDLKRLAQPLSAAQKTELMQVSDVK
jgi:NitT/TauT family transport system substrate-binding protein